MGIAQRPEVKDPSHANECPKEDGGSVLKEHIYRDFAEIKTKWGVGGSEGEIRGVEGKFEVINSSRCTKRVYGREESCEADLD